MAERIKASNTSWDYTYSTINIPNIMLSDHFNFKDIDISEILKFMSETDSIDKITKSAIIIHGNRGTGKTALAYYIANNLIEHSKVRIIDADFSIDYILESIESLSNKYYTEHKIAIITLRSKYNIDKVISSLESAGKNRILIYHNNINTQHNVNILKAICNKEGVKVDNKTLEYLIKISNTNNMNIQIRLMCNIVTELKINELEEKHIDLYYMLRE
jgi:predicted ATP-dependent serine protease